MRTYTPKPGDTTGLHVIDATDVVLGRWYPVAALLRGKHKAFAPHVDAGDL